MARGALLTGIFSFFILTGGIAMAEDSFYSLTATRIDGQTKSLSEFKGKVALVVNVASQCGYTPQYAELQSIYDQFKEKGFVVLGFPSNDFGGQEPGTEAEIQKFCSSKFGVTFPLFAKVKVEGASKHPVYELLTRSTGGSEVGWNFEKFLVGRDGLVLERFSSGVRPSSPQLIGSVERALQAKP